MNDETETGCVRLSTEANKRIVRITKRGNAVGLQRMNKVEGDIAELLKEGKIIQNHLRTSSRRTDNTNEARIARTFSKLMMEGKVRSAFRLLARGGQSGILTLNQITEESTGKTVKDI